MLEATVIVLPVKGEDLTQTQLGGLLDSAVELHEREPEAPGQTLSNRGFPGAAQAEQRNNPLRARSGSASSAAAVVPSARATSTRRRTEMLPRPDSSCTRNRAERPERSAASRNVHPRFTRNARALAPSSLSTSSDIDGDMFLCMHGEERTRMAMSCARCMDRMRNLCRTHTKQDRIIGT